MDWSGFLNKSITELKNVSKCAMGQKYNVSKIIFTGSAIVMVTLAIASSIVSPKRKKRGRYDEENEFRSKKSRSEFLEDKKKSFNGGKKRKRKFKP